MNVNNFFVALSNLWYNILQNHEDKELVMMNEPVVKTGMLIRRPVQEVFDAFVDPSITTKFWFTKSSGKLEAGKRIRWEWEMYGASADIDVKVLEANKRIVIEWPATVEWMFTPHGDDAAYVQITNSGFEGGADERVGEAIDCMGGFTMMLCALKALLEHDVILNVVADKEPPGHIG